MKNKNCISHVFNLQMELMTYLRLKMAIFHKYYAPFLSSKNYEGVSTGIDYDSVEHIFCCHKNIILDLLLDKSKSLEWRISLFFSQGQEIIVTYVPDKLTH